MPGTASRTFEYAVRNKSGKVVKGRIEAQNQAAVATRLRAMGVAPLAISEVATSGLSREIKIPGFGDKIGMKDLAIMSRQMATMINAGLSLLRALNILAEQTESKPLAKVLFQVRSDVEAGSSLSASMGRHPIVFPPLMINMIKAGEVGGFLDQVLVSVAENYESEVKLRSKIKSAMTYPVVVFAMAILATAGMLLFIVPVFAGMFASLGGELPLPTRILVTMSDIMKILAPILLVVGIIFGVWWRKHKNDEAVRNRLDPLKLKVPIFGSLFRKVAVARFTRNFGTMIHAGVPILQALDIVGETSGNMVVEGSKGGTGLCAQRSVAGCAAERAPGLPAHGGPDDHRRRGHRCPRRDAEEDRRVLRPGGRGDHRAAHVADRAPDDRDPGHDRRLDDHRPVHADLLDL